MPSSDRDGRPASALTGRPVSLRALRSVVADADRGADPGTDGAAGRHASAAALVSLGQRVDPDPLAAFRAATIALRWGTVGASLVMVGGDLGAGDPVATVVALVVVISGALLRTVHPVRDAPGSRLAAVLVLEITLHVGAVLATGGWRSPFFLTLLPPVLVAGFARGVGWAVAAALGTAAAVGGGGLAFEAAGGGDAADLTVELLVVGVIAGWTRRVAGVRDAERLAALGEAGRLAEANALLVELHALTQTLPSSPDLDGALDAVVSQIGTLLTPDGVMVLLLDDTDATWQVARCAGRYDDGAATGPVVLSILQRRAVRERVVVHDSATMAAALVARGAVIGLVVVSSSSGSSRTRARDAAILAGLVEPAALAVDNARWFVRLRTVGAEEERNRIARDLHDRIGQSLAYLAFELDRLVRRSEKVGISGDELGPALHQLRTETREVIREVRDTLYDLRTDVTDERGLGVVLDACVERVRARSGLAIELAVTEAVRAPLPQERELLRIAQEALHNIERHAQAEHVVVTWRHDATGGALLVADDGVGLADHELRNDTYGLAGMRERAAGIGARLEFDSVAGRGTTVRCTLGRASTTTTTLDAVAGQAVAPPATPSTA